MKVNVIIPVRSGSKRVVNKNVRPFAGSTLLEIKIRQLINLESVERIYVNSDDQAMLDLASKYGVMTVLREPYFASDSIPMSEVYKNMAENSEGEHILLTHVTNPLAGERLYRRVIEEYFQLPVSMDSVTTVSDVKEFLYKDGNALNFDSKLKPRSQDLPNIVKLNHVASILPRDVIISRKEIVGHSPKFLKIDDMESLDIDTPLDFDVAEFLYGKYEKAINAVS